MIQDLISRHDEDFKSAVRDHLEQNHIQRESVAKSVNTVLKATNEMKDRVIRELRTDIFNKTEEINRLKLKNKKLKRFVSGFILTLDKLGLMSPQVMKLFHEHAKNSRFDQEFLEKCLKHAKKGAEKKVVVNHKKLDQEQVKLNMMLTRKSTLIHICRALGEERLGDERDREERPAAEKSAPGQKCAYPPKEGGFRGIKGHTKKHWKQQEGDVKFKTQNPFFHLRTCNI